MNSKLSFKLIARKNGLSTYEVRTVGSSTLAGTVEKRISTGEVYWLGRYNDGTAAYAADTRIDAAWALINS